MSALPPRGGNRGSNTRRLPVRPSEEHLRKQAKRLAKAEDLPLATAQHRLATEYGARNWAELLSIVTAMNSGADQLENVQRNHRPLPKAARARDIDLIRQILASGDYTHYDLDTGLAHAAWYGGDAPEVLAVRRQIFDLLLEHGADPDAQYGSAYGPLVFGTGECLSPEGLQWLLDAGCDVGFPQVRTKYGLTCAIDTWLGTYARGQNAKKHRGLHLLLAHNVFIPANVPPELVAVHRGDVATLAKLIDTDPTLPMRSYPDLPYGNTPLLGGTLLHAAVEFGELAVAQLLLDRGADANARTAAGDSPLMVCCLSRPETDDRIAIARLLIDRGAILNNFYSGGRYPLHAAAMNGPLELVELLLSHDARDWVTDNEAKAPRDVIGDIPDKAAIAELLTRPVIRDPHFRAAVKAIHTGDLPALKQLLADHPSLVHDRIIEPDCLEKGYFSNPKLLWFVAFNPMLAKIMPANILEITRTIIDAGASPDDVGYTLELVLTSDPAQQQGFQTPLTDLLLARGATIKPATVYTILGHGQRAQVELLLAKGQPLTAPIAAGLGRVDVLPALLANADAETRHAALSMAVINNQVEAARLCLATGVPVNARVVIHQHATPLHIAAGNGFVEMTKLLLAHGADRSIKDTLWHGTPYGWATHGKHPETQSLLIDLAEK